MSKPALKKCFTYVRWYTDRGISFLKLSHDYNWLTRKYIPALKQCEKVARSEKERHILSDGYELLGDIYDIMGAAPTMAIKAYRRSLKFDPLNAASHRELGDLLVHTGQPDQGIRHLRKAVKLWPEDDCAALGLKYALEDKEPMKNLLYAKDDIEWQIMDMIISGKGKEALEKLQGKRGVTFHQIRTYAYASLGMEEEYLKEWEKIQKLKSPVEFKDSDWFFMTENLYAESKIWDIWLKMDGRFMPSISFPRPNCYSEYFKIPKKKTNKNASYGAPDYYTKAFLKVINRMNRLYFMRQSAWVNRDIDTLKKLYKKYPKCKDLKRLIKSLQ